MDEILSRIAVESALTERDDLVEKIALMMIEQTLEKNADKKTTMICLMANVAFFEHVAARIDEYRLLLEEELD